MTPKARRWELVGSAPEILVSTSILPDSLNAKYILGAAFPHHYQTGNFPEGL